ncbi:MAG: hypothetical protein Ct9H90mP25_3460 [Gammaproteobacteria bacterium]|nr:MAG: hypothetical protein Ct9H90mP25_3460 [Gammaproteobacteria bacterium]
MDPLCATFIPFDDPELAARSKQIYTPYSLTEPYIVAHGGSSFGSASFSPRTQLVYITGKKGAISLTVQPVGDSLPQDQIVEAPPRIIQLLIEYPRPIHPP